MSNKTSDRSQLGYVKEVTYGVTPTTGDHKALRFTGESLNFGFQTDSSKEIRPDRQVTDLTLVGASAQGGINIEASYGEYDDLIAAALQSSWVDYGTAGAGAAAAVTINSTTGTLTWGAAPTGNNVLTGGTTKLEDGQYFRLTAPGDAADGQIIKIAARTATSITADASTPILGTGTRTDVAGTFITTSRLVNGSEQPSFSIEKGFLEPGSLTVGEFFNHRGMTVSKWMADFKESSFLTGSFEFMGKDVVVSQNNNTLLAGNRAESTTNAVYNAVDNVGTISVDGAPFVNTDVMSMNFSVDNRLRGRKAISVLGNRSIGSGKCVVEGSMELYFDDTTYYNKFRANQSVAIEYTVADQENNGYAYVFGKVKFKDAQVNAGGEDQDVMISLPYQAIRDEVKGRTMTIYRFHA